MSAIAVWKQRVAAHHAQSQQVRAALGVVGADIWEPLSPFFKADPHRTDDFEVARLAREVNPSTTLLDIGGCWQIRLAVSAALPPRHSGRTVARHGSEPPSPGCGSGY